MKVQYETYVERSAELLKGQYDHSIKITTGHCCPVSPNTKVHYVAYLSRTAKYDSLLKK